ncbi:major facilitator family protein [Cyclospora cayetanensis]|uniref:Major facilitator family protein n=1 Tax=Cyclospora cayetanensis TaxID=88456 RepID=A0A1D3D2Y9_9EIME|nr:major facilitator family protein [Cyclospora cayetanensis]
MVGEKNSHKGKWLVLLGSCLLMIGGGAAFSWSALAYHLFTLNPTISTDAAQPFSCYSLSGWAVLVYTMGLLLGLPAGALLDNHMGPRLPSVLGASNSFFACMGGSFDVTSHWNILLSFAFLNGLGFGLVLFPASTVALRWDPKSCAAFSTLKGTAFMGGFLVFAPTAVALMAPASAFSTHRSNLLVGRGAFAALSDASEGAEASLSNMSTVVSAVRVLTGTMFFLQIVGCVFVENPPWFSARDARSVSGEGREVGSSSGSGSGRNGEPKPPVFADGSDKRVVYLSHLLSPFSLTSVWDTALKVQGLFLSLALPSPWEPTAVGVSLRVRQALRTPRAWVLLGIATLSRFVAIAFGPHRMAFLLFLYSSVCTSVGFLGAALAAQFCLPLQGGWSILFGSAAAGLVASLASFLAARCHKKRYGRILDLPCAYHFKFRDAEGPEGESGAKKAPKDFLCNGRDDKFAYGSSDYSFPESESDDPSKPLNLSKAVKEYHQQQKVNKEFDGPLLASCGGFIQEESIVHFPAANVRQTAEEYAIEPSFVEDDADILPDAQEAELEGEEAGDAPHAQEGSAAAAQGDAEEDSVASARSSVEGGTQGVWG